jgi:Spy/CpxP family protein refolding chaperone
MKKTIVALSLIAVMLLGLGYAYAQGGGYGPGYGRAHPQRFANLPNLTPEQKAKFDELRRKFNEETAQIQGALVAKRLELRSLWSNPKAEDKAILEKQKELRDLQNQMMDKGVQFKLEVRKILTPEQISQFGPGWGMGRGMRGGMGGFGPGTGPGMGYRHRMGC